MSGAPWLMYWVVWNLAPGAGPESFLGVHTAVPAFGDEDSGGDPDLVPGLAVTIVVENSPAAAAGLQAGDRVLRVNGETLRNPQHLEAFVAAMLPGSELRIAARRGSELLDLTAHTVPRVEPRKAPEVTQLIERRRLGLALATLTGEDCERFHLEPGDGVRVRRLLAGSPAEGSGLLPGDVIVTVNGKVVHGSDDFLALAAELAPGERTSLTISREGRLSQLELVARDPDSYVSYFHFPGVVIYEHEPRKQETTFGVILNVFKYTRKENRRTYRFLWIISFSTGTNEELEEVAE
jgi:S1-C subfamily serine protease